MYPSELATKITLRLPDDVKAFLAREAQKNGSSQNSEIIRALRERMARTKETAPESAGTLARA